MVTRNRTENVGQERTYLGTEGSIQKATVSGHDSSWRRAVRLDIRHASMDAIYGKIMEVLAEQNSSSSISQAHLTQLMKILCISEPWKTAKSFYIYWYVRLRTAGASLAR